MCDPVELAAMHRARVGDVYEDGTGQRVELVELEMASPTWWRVRCVVASLAGPLREGQTISISEWALVFYGHRAARASLA